MNRMAPYRHLHISESPQTQYIAQPETNPSQILGRPRHNSSRIPIDSLQQLSQSPMAVILLIPHIFVVHNPLARPIPSLLHRLRTVKQLDRIQLGAIAVKNLPASVTLEVCTHSDSIRDYALRSRHINWAAANSVATSPRRRTSQTRPTLLRALKAAQVLN